MNELKINGEMKKVETDLIMVQEHDGDRIKYNLVPYFYSELPGAQTAEGDPVWVKTIYYVPRRELNKK